MSPSLATSMRSNTLFVRSAQLAFKEHERSMTAPDILHSVGKGFVTAFPSSRV